MNVYLTFDIEVWCNGWNDLDARFPASFERYVYGRSRHGEYALPKTLEILDRHGIKGVFFVEPLFAARFGVEHLATIVELIAAGGHEIELHLHPEWADEIQPLVFPGATRKRQHLSYYTLEEQRALIELGLALLRQAGVETVGAFRAGSYAANADTYRALAGCGIRVDSSLNHCHADSGADLRETLSLLAPIRIAGVEVLPVTVFRDGFGKSRPAQVGACAFAELRDALASAADVGMAHFVIVSHNFEMLRQGRSEPDRLVVARFEALCRHLAENRADYRISDMRAPPGLDAVPAAAGMPVASSSATLRRHIEQAVRRLAG